MPLLALLSTNALIAGAGALSWDAEPAWDVQAALDLIAPPACVQDGEPLRSEFVRIAREQEVAGAAVGVWLDGRIVLQEYVGRADLDAGTPVTAETQFGIASVTKAFTGMTAWNLVRQGRLDLDTPISRYGTFFPGWAESLTPRMLLTHVTGLPHPNSRTPELFATHYTDVAQAMQVFKDVEPLSAAGTRFSYSSSNYNLLAAVLQAVGEKPFDLLVREHVIDPVGLEHTGFDDVRVVRPGRSERYAFLDPWSYAATTDLRRVPTWDYSFNMAGGNMYSTVGDLLRFGGWMLQTVASHPELLDPLRPGSDSLSRSPWGYGWFTGARNQLGRRLLISGSNPGVLAALEVFPEQRMAVVALTNTWGKNARSGAIVDSGRFGRICLGMTEG